MFFSDQTSIDMAGGATLWLRADMSAAPEAFGANAATDATHGGGDEGGGLRPFLPVWGDGEPRRRIRGGQLATDVLAASGAAASVWPELDLGGLRRQVLALEPTARRGNPASSASCRKIKATPTADRRRAKSRTIRCASSLLLV